MKGKYFLFQITRPVKATFIRLVNDVTGDTINEVDVSHRGLSHFDESQISLLFEDLNKTTSNETRVRLELDDGVAVPANGIGCGSEQTTWTFTLTWDYPTESESLFIIHIFLWVRGREREREREGERERGGEKTVMLPCKELVWHRDFTVNTCVLCEYFKVLQCQVKK